VAWRRLHPTSLPTRCYQLPATASLAGNLLPPERKGHHHPITKVIDAETGLVLSTRNNGFTSVMEWMGLEIGVEIADSRFTY
jgi:hypothetical protein